MENIDDYLKAAREVYAAGDEAKARQLLQTAKELRDAQVAVPSNPDTYNIDDYLKAAREVYAAGDEAKARQLLQVAKELRDAQSAPRDPDAYNPDEHEGVMQEFFEGVASGATKLVQGPSELVASAVDLVADTDYASGVTEAFEDFRAQTGIDPRGISGAIGEVGVQFVLPGVLAAKAVGALSNAGRVGTFARQLGAAAAADAVVATNDTMTLGDFFEGGPTETGEDIGLEGGEEAARRLLNKLKVGAEGAAAVVAAPLLVRGVTAGAGAAATAAGQIPGVTQAARVAQKGIEAVGQKLGEVEEAVRMGEEVGGFKRALGQTLATLRYRGLLPEEVGEARSFVTGMTEAEVQGATKLASRLDKSLDKVIKEANRATASASPLTRKDLLNSIEKYLTSKNRRYANRVLQNNIPQALHADVRLMRDQIDALSNDILNSGFLRQMGNVTPAGARQTLNQTIRGNLGSYMRRRYRVFEDPNYAPDQATFDAAVQGFLGDRSAIDSVFKKLVESGKYTPGQLGVNVNPNGTVFGTIGRDQAEMAAREFLASYKRRVLPKGVNRVADHRLPTDLFITRANLRDYQKALLGEVHNPLENFVATVADMAEFKAVDSYFSRINELATANPNTFGKWFKDTSAMSPQQRRLLQEDGYRILGEGDDPLSSGWGTLAGYAVPDQIYKDLTRTVVGDAGAVGNAARAAYSGFLRAKGAAQYAKTVLSPITQIRNVTTAGLFAAMQGNIGRGASLGESLRLVFENLSPTQMTDEFAKLQRLGVVGSQAELREIQDLISKGFGYTQSATVNGLPVGRRIGSWVTDNPIGAFFRGAGKRAENLYQAGDDIWKIYNYTFERNKLGSALRNMSPQDQAAYITQKSGRPMSLDDFLDDEAARIVRNTVPNYNLAPESIKFLRKLPVGNFIAFPYEIMRTGVNTVARGIEELASPNVEIQKIGLRRLMGALTTTSVIGPTLSHMAYQLSGVSEDEMKAYQRSIAPPWEKNARLIPTGRQEDGTPKYINWSYSNPYDILERTVIGAMNKMEEGQALGKGAEQIAFEAFSESLGEVLSPFTEEAIITAKVRDVLDPESKVPGVRQLAQLAGGRGGETVTGARVYNPQDNAGDKALKSFAHIMDAIIPSAVPVDVRGGEFEPSRFARAMVNQLGLNEELGISEKDRMGIERDLTQELARAFSGVTESESTATIGLKYKGYEFARARQDASNIFNRVARRPNVRPEELVAAYTDANEARYRVYNQFHQLVEDLRTFGVPDRKIRKTLEDANISGVDALLRGRYEPLQISEQVLADMRRNGTITQLPRAELRLMQRGQRGREFGEVEVEQEADMPVTAPAAPPQGFVIDPVQSLPQGFQIDMPAPAPAPPTAAPTGPRSSALLGSNPIDAAKNAEIQARQ